MHKVAVLRGPELKYLFMDAVFSQKEAEMEPDLYEVTLRSKQPSKTAVRPWLTNYNRNRTAQVVLGNEVEQKSDSAYSLLRQRRLCERCVNPSRLWLRHTCCPKKNCSIMHRSSGDVASRARECRHKDSSYMAPSGAVQEARALQKCSAFCVRHLMSKKVGRSAKAILSNTASTLKPYPEQRTEEQKRARSPACVDCSPDPVCQPAHQRQTEQRRQQSAAESHRPRQELTGKRHFVYSSTKSFPTSRPPQHEITPARRAVHLCPAAALGRIQESNMRNEKKTADISSFSQPLSTIVIQPRDVHVLLAGRDDCVGEFALEKSRNVISKLPERQVGTYPYSEKEGNSITSEEKLVVPVETLLSPKCGETLRGDCLYSVSPFQAPHINQYFLYSYGERRTKSVPCIRASISQQRKCKSSGFSRNYRDLFAKSSSPYGYNTLSELHGVYTEQGTKWRESSRITIHLPSSFNLIWRLYGTCTNESAVSKNDGAARLLRGIWLPAGFIDGATTFAAAVSRNHRESYIHEPFDENDVSVMFRRFRDDDRHGLVCPGKSYARFKRKQGELCGRDSRGEPQLSILRESGTFEKRTHSGATTEGLSLLDRDSSKTEISNSLQLFGGEKPAFDLIVSQQCDCVSATDSKVSSDYRKDPGINFFVGDFNRNLERECETQKKKEQDSRCEFARTVKREESAHLLSVDQCRPFVRLICERATGIFSSIERFLQEKDPDRKREELDQVYLVLFSSHRMETKVKSATLLV